jgi:hypothetical protein
MFSNNTGAHLFCLKCNGMFIFGIITAALSCIDKNIMALLTFSNNAAELLIGKNVMALSMFASNTAACGSFGY